MQIGIEVSTNEHHDAWCSGCGERLLLPGTAGGPPLEVSFKQIVEMVAGQRLTDEQYLLVESHHNCWDEQLSYAIDKVRDAVSDSLGLPNGEDDYEHENHPDDPSIEDERSVEATMLDREVGLW